MTNRYILSIILFISFSHIDAQSFGGFTDTRDNATYKTIEIDNQVWMAENLKFWVPKESPYYLGESFFYEGVDAYGLKYGRLYQWETACKVCPEGWHLPSIDEWLTLLNRYGQLFVNDYETQTIKELRKAPKEERKARKALTKETFIKFIEGGGSGFDVLYGGYLNLGGPGPYSDLGTIANFWSSSDNVTYGMLKKSKAEGIRFKKWGKSFGPWGIGKTVYLSVRCVKNK